MSFWDKEEELISVDKNSTEKIVVKRVETKGKQFIDIRINFPDKDSGEYRPSSKGVAIPADKFESIVEAVLSTPKDTAE